MVEKGNVYKNTRSRTIIKVIDIVELYSTKWVEYRQYITKSCYSKEIMTLERFKNKIKFRELIALKEGWD